MDWMRWADRSWPLLARVTRAHVAVYRATRGVVGHRFPGGPPMLLLEHRGARTGRLRTVPLVYGVVGRDLVVVASKAGYPRHPAWFHNLRACPETHVQVGARRLPVRARVADPAEHERLWPVMVGLYRPFETYRRRAGRELPVLVLEPRP
ncbi:nitroreductase/quinone reductase family protein [Streptomyces chromofuscus]|uniref:Nitroreductase family deazaflavin-dependent oxidoreductase n=1 Tax=Streptomyces chromofuscus TaxID=42881 RepID=A0A7M2T9J1_STRCW|nr:nitroreductase/quinone reductase family protein [Streptomyces chromofuscus]QOV44914.1 nitroreductase family deazaflavin-dependent oxidoreductase [Streptomyces chromofuscus]GGT36817.1 nitroreductase [Streptomyces chromofuscus]